MTQLMRPDGKDKNRSAGTVKCFPGMMTAMTLCFATKHASFLARPQAPHASPMLLMSCRHPTQAENCGAGTGAMVPGARAPHQPPSLMSDHAGGGAEPGREP